MGPMVVHPVVPVIMYALVLNLQALVADLEAVHLLDGVFGGNHGIVRNETWSRGEGRENREREDDVRRELTQENDRPNHSPKPLLSPVYLST